MIEQLEAIVFSEGGEVTIKTLLGILGVTLEELATIVGQYNTQQGGMVLVIDDKKVLMRVAGEHAGLLEQLRSDVQNEDLSKAWLEVLAIVLYSEVGNMSASEVEHIRGVNSGYTLRQLTMRGFLSKTRKGMGYQYAPTAELLSFLGVTNSSDLPEVVQVRQQVSEFLLKNLKKIHK